MIFQNRSINQRRFRIVKYLIFYIFIFNILFVYNINASTLNKDKYKILFISSYNLDFISFSDQMAGISEGLDNKAEIITEYMDFKTFYNKENEDNFYNVIKYTLKNYEDIDAIIAGDDEATEFCVKYREDIFNDIPIVFLGVQDFERVNRALELDDVYGVAEGESIKANIELIRKFHPNVKTITFIDSLGLKLYEDITEQYDDLEFKYIITEDKSPEEMKILLSNLGSNDAIIQLYVNTFKDGIELNLEDANELIVENCKGIPIYVILSYDVGEESIGGKVISHYNQGKNAGEIVYNLLNCKVESNLFISEDKANEYIFNYKALRKFNIKINDLPEGSKVINNPNEILKDYKYEILGILILFLALISIIVSQISYINYKSKYEREILKSKKKAEEATNMKSQLLSNISHELKTPINVIASAIQLTKSSKNEIVTYKNHLDIIENNTNRLIRLVNNTIDVHNINIDDILLDVCCVNIVEVVENITMLAIPYTESKKLNIMFDTNIEEVFMKVDINKLERAILNLLSNAIKFSKVNGEIKVTINVEDFIYIIIEDNGVGIGEDHISNIFNKFIQVDNSFYRLNEGSGIGLAITKLFIELHNGSIEVFSKINQGAKFIIKLPREELVCNYVGDIENNNFTQNVKIELSDLY